MNYGGWLKILIEFMLIYHFHALYWQPMDSLYLMPVLIIISHNKIRSMRKYPNMKPQTFYDSS